MLFFLLVSVFYVGMSLSLGLIFSATSATAGRGGAEDGALQHPAGAALRLRVPDPQHADRRCSGLTELIPATHFIRVTRAIYLRGAGPLELWSELLFLAVFGVVLIALALRTLERRT